MGEAEESIEETKGERGPATRSRDWGCAACRLRLIQAHKAAMKKTAGESMGQRREAKRLAQAWKDEEEIREDKMRTTSSSSRHTLVGQCDGADKILQASLHRTVTALAHCLHLTVEKAAAKGTGGEEVLRVVTRARSAMDDAAKRKR